MTSPLVFIPVIGVVLLAAVFIVVPAIKIVQQFQQGVLFRFGRFVTVRKPGFNVIIPYVDRLMKVDMRTTTLVVEPQEVITRDNVTIKVDAVVYFNVVRPADAVIKVVDYGKATTQISLTTLRSVLGQSDLDELLSHRDKINVQLRQIIDDQTEPWGVKVTVVEVKDVLLPENMQRAMARQAEAEREKRAKIIHAEGEDMAAGALAHAAKIIATQPAALQLRYLQTLTEMAGERNSTIIPLPIDVLNVVRELTAAAAGDGNH